LEKFGIPVNRNLNKKIQKNSEKICEFVVSIFLGNCWGLLVCEEIETLLAVVKSKVKLIYRFELFWNMSEYVGIFWTFCSQFNPLHCATVARRTSFRNFGQKDFEIYLDSLGIFKNFFHKEMLFETFSNDNF
jgi:hypothetical protein